MTFLNAFKVPVLLLSLVQLLNSCGEGMMAGNNSAAANIPDGITGKIDNTDAEMIHLYRLAAYNKNELLASAPIDENNEFAFEEDKLDSKKDFYYLSVDKKTNFSFMLDQGDDVFVHLDAEHMKIPLEVLGPDYLQSYADFSKGQGEIEDQISALNKKYIATKDATEKRAFQDEAMGLMEEKEKLAQSFIQENKDHALALGALSYLPLRKEENLDLIDEVLKSNQDMSKTLIHSSLKTQMIEGKKNLMQIKNQEKKILDLKNTHMKMLSKGVPEIKMDNPQGEELSLKSLQGKVVLIDFWASWCSPCRKENPNVVAAYNKYKDDGFEIFSVSLDKDIARWEAAIKQDGLVWPNHVSDLMGWQNKAAKLYNVHSVPHTVLLGRDGEAIDVMIRGRELEEKLEEIFGY